MSISDRPAELTEACYMVLWRSHRAAMASLTRRGGPKCGEPANPRPGVPPRMRRARCVTLFLVALIWSGSAWADNDELEYAVKATYICKIPAFVTWPAAVRPDADFVICVVGQGPIGPLLDSAAAGQTVRQRPVVVRRYQTIVNNPGCQLMFVAGSDAQPVAAVLAAVRGTPVLTITDNQSDMTSIGIINFVLSEGHVRFEIDMRSASNNGLVISSKLLSLATRVRDRLPQ
jgi:hypothetical protein